MHRRKSITTSAERGQVLLVAALFMSALLGFAAMAIDAGLVYQDRRGQQNAADAAALAAASALPDPVNAVLRARDWADRNGYGDGQNGGTVTVNTPYKSDPTKVEVVIKRPLPAAFARVLGINTFTVTARAVATKTSGNSINVAFLALNPTNCGTFGKSGGSNVYINNGGAIMVDSSCNPGAIRTGGGSVTAAAIDYYYPGGYTESGSGSFNPTPAPYPSRIEDPLAGTPVPDINTLGTSPDSGGNANAPKLKNISSGVTILHPGVYYGGLSIGSSANVTFLPGVYYLAGGGLALTGSGTITGSGVMFYNSYDPVKPTKDGACSLINLRGTAHFTFTGAASGPYKNIVLWQDRACTGDLSLEGGGGGVGGVIYAPGARVDLTGSGNLGSIQVIADSVNIAGTGDLTVDFIPYVPIPLGGGAKLIE